jgi:glycosyltransferase involved in cell wall biosynthesis
MISIVFPVYNEQTSLPKLFGRIEEMRVRIGLPTEVIFVDDHSSDGSPEVLKQFCAVTKGTRFLRLSRNSGSHVAILAGLEASRGECAIFLASDLQDPPELIAELLQRRDAGAQVVWAVRARREGISLTEKSFSHAFYWLLNNFSEVSLPPAGADFALLDRVVINALISAVGANVSLGADIASLGFRSAEVTYVKAARLHGKSGWTLRKKIKAMIDCFVAHSFAPIRVMSWIGFLMAFLGIVIAAFVFASRLTHDRPVEGWASLMIVLLVLGGTQIVMLGILGEYLVRTLRETRRRPRCFLEEESSS